MMLYVGMPWWTDASSEELERALKRINRTRLQFWLPRAARAALKSEADNYSHLLKRMREAPIMEPVIENKRVAVTQEEINQVLAVLPTDSHTYMLEAEIAEKSNLPLEVVQSVLWQEVGNLCSWTTGGMTYKDGKPERGLASWQGIAYPNLRRRTNFANHDGPMTHEEAFGGL